MECSIWPRRRASGVQLSDLRALPPPEIGVAGIRRRPGCRRRRHRCLTYVVSPGDVTDQLHGQVHGTELSCKRLPSRWIGLSLTQHIIHEIHHVTSGNRHTLVDQFAASGPRHVSFRTLHQTSGFALHGLEDGVHDVGLYLASSSRSSNCSLRPRPRPQGHLARVFHLSLYLLSSTSRSKGRKTELATVLVRPIGNLHSVPRRPAVAVRCVFSWQLAFVSEPTRVTSSCIYSNDASVIRSMECSFFVGTLG